MPKLCRCKPGTRGARTRHANHYHTPGGFPDSELEAMGFDVLPFRPGKTARDRRKGKARQLVRR